jgi:hypothetical protein
MHTTKLGLRLFLELAGLAALGYRAHRHGSSTIAETAGRS